MSGPLAGLRVIELAGIGPGPFAAMLLADMGAEVLRVDRVEAVGSRPSPDVVNRGRRSVAVDLKTPEGVSVVLRLAECADAFIEGFRPGVAERLGVGPEDCHGRNARLVYGRMTGWGQSGPYANSAGHDINYVALAGTLHMIGRAGSAPVPPLNLVGDYGGGGMLMAFGMVCGLLEASRSGSGQVVDAAMVDGAAVLATVFHGLLATGGWKESRGTNLLDSGAHFYDVYETADGKYVSVGALEPQFYAELVQRLGLEKEDLPRQMDRRQWPDMRDRLAATFRTKSRDEWCRIMEGADACFAPVLTPTEAPNHPHNHHRGTFVEVDGVRQPAPAPRFSRTKPQISRPPSIPGQHTDDALRDWGFNEDEVRKLRLVGAVA